MPSLARALRPISASAVYQLLDNGALYCLDLASGAEIWAGAAGHWETDLDRWLSTPFDLLCCARQDCLPY